MLPPISTAMGSRAQGSTNEVSMMFSPRSANLCMRSIAAFGFGVVLQVGLQLQRSVRDVAGLVLHATPEDLPVRCGFFARNSPARKIESTKPSPSTFSR